MKLIDELNKTKQKDADQYKADPVVNEVNRLLLNAHDEDVKTLEAVGLDHHIRIERRLTEEHNRLKKSEEIYARPAFTGKQIKELCNTYYLKLLPARDYKGTIPPDLAKEIRVFCEQHDLTPNLYEFYILAPMELFRTVKLKAYQKPIDPIFFYKERKTFATSNSERYAIEDDTFLAVKDWGDDFTDLRTLKILWNNTFEPYKSKSDQTTPRFYTKFAIAFAIISYMLALGGLFVLSLFPLLISAGFLVRNILSNHHIDTLWNEPGI